MDSKLDSSKITRVGMGLWKVTDATQFGVMFEAAVKAGYRHFDTAQAYGNEQFLGECLSKSGLKRSEVFITTKIMVQHYGYTKTMQSFEASLKKLQTGYVDLVLLHFPGLPWHRKSAWRALQDIKSAGRAKAIGVSNYKIKHLEAMTRYAREMPTVNQVEMHVFLQQQELRNYCFDHKIQIQAYSPLAHGYPMTNQVIDKIAKKHGKSYAQIMLRWCIDVGAVPLPKSTNPIRIAENINIFDFKLDDTDLKQLESLDRHMRTLWKSIIFG